MKKLLLLILATAFYAHLLAQDSDPLQKGNFLLGGTLSGFYDQEEILNFHYAYDVEIHPTFGYLPFNRFVVGITPSTSIIWSKTNPRDKYERQTNLEISPLLRYYVWKKFYISFEPGYKRGHILTSGAITTTKGFSLNQGIGYDLFINRNIALEIGYYYYYSKEKIPYDYLGPLINDLVTNRFKLNIGIQIIL